MGFFFEILDYLFSFPPTYLLAFPFYNAEKEECDYGSMDESNRLSPHEHRRNF